MYKKVLLSSIITLTLISPAYAVSPTPTPSTEPASIDQVTENLKKRLQDTQETKEATPTASARAYIGTVKDVIKDTLIMQDKDGKKDVKLVEGTTILRSPGNTVIQADNIRIDDYIIAIGYPDGDDILTGRRLIVSVDPIKPPAKVSGLGTIAKIGKNSLTLKLSDKDQLLATTTKTIIKSAFGTIEFSELAVGDTLIYTAMVDNDDHTATVIMRTQTASISQ